MHSPSLLAIALAIFVTVGVAPASAQAPAAAPAATPKPLPPPTAEALDQIVQRALDAYNTGDFAKFFSVYAMAGNEKPDAKAFAAIVGDFHKNFGLYETRTLRPEWVELTSERPTVGYVGRFKKLPKANLMFRFKATADGFKIDHMSILDGNVNN